MRNETMRKVKVTGRMWMRISEMKMKTKDDASDI